MPKTTVWRSDETGFISGSAQAVGESVEPPIGNELEGCFGYGRQMLRLGGDAQHELDELLGVGRVEQEPGLAIADKVTDTAAGIGDKDWQPCGHGFVNDEAPRLGFAGMNESARQGVISGQIVVGDEAGELHVRG